MNNKYAWEVPEYTQTNVKPKQHDYCTLIFVINEGEKLIKQLSRMDKAKACTDIVIADGGSTDGSTSFDNLKKYGVTSLLVKTGYGKLGSQMRMGFAWALSQGYKGAIVVDGNNKDSVDDIPNFVNQLENGMDHVQGSRFIPGGKHINTPKSRLIGLKVIHVPLIRLFSGFKYTDTTNGFRAYSAKFLADEKLAAFRNIFIGYEFHYYLAIQAAKLGFNCIEIPVMRTYPKHGKIPTKISPIRGNLQVIIKLLEVCLGKYNKK
ncbi:glycosyltransferase family 2 protein [Photorhabdus bodei]|uniref:Glycosyltransferase family 2 protein n=1 Tax=Photorhabdus bodei TaxID=2029681 RepID=A0AAW6BQE2_9GAMM|nr:glycosyltransferase family 2 protein [Photorhabdus bodei]MDB6374971.1 glycosyltransferase family 2 protein [Photorhabdus bodei]